MRKFIHALLTGLCVTLPFGVRGETAVPGQWRLHNTFDSYFQETIDTPGHVYLLALAQRVNSSSQFWSQIHGQLFVLDKESGEVTGYNASNYLKRNEILDIAYNPERRYLLIVHDDYTIALLDDDGNLRVIPGLASSTLNSSKNVNHITFDPERKRAYLATDFGYIVVDDEKAVIPESRIYNAKVNSLGRVGDKLVMGRDEGLFTSPLSDRHTSLDSWTPVAPEFSGISGVLPLTDSTFGITHSKGVGLGTFGQDGALAIKSLSDQVYTYVTDNRDGYLLLRWGMATQLNRKGRLQTAYTEKVGGPDARYASWDFRDFYYPVARKGLQRSRYLGNYQWEQGEEYPVDAPRPTGVFSLDYSDKAGMLAGNETHNLIYSYSDNTSYPGLVSGYKSGSWTSYGTDASDSQLAKYMHNTYGPVVDPLEPQYMWLGSRNAGLFRVNMEDRSIELFSHPEHEAYGLKGFHSLFPTSVSWKERCLVSAISFDAEGNLWCHFNPSHAEAGATPLYCWPAKERLAGHTSAFKAVPAKGYVYDYENYRLAAAKTTQSRGTLVFASASMYQKPLHVFYYGPSVEDTSDDRLFSFTSFADQDGTAVPYIHINAIYEDPATGYFWIGTDTGVFYFSPIEAARTGGSVLHVRRPKVARGDGTNLADYLLSGADVMAIASDGAGRKWFGTNGGGILISSGDGTRVIDQFTEENSMLPSDNVYSIGFDPTGNAVWIGGARQTSTYFCDATPAAEDYSEVLAFPNPVRPEHSGPVTIQGLMDDSLVKIVDASGSLVCELGTSNGGMAQWDLTDMKGRPVGAGVYYILSSTSAEAQGSKGNSTKILVIR